MCGLYENNEQKLEDIFSEEEWQKSLLKRFNSLVEAIAKKESKLINMKTTNNWLECLMNLPFKYSLDTISKINLDYKLSIIVILLTKHSYQIMV